MYWFSCGGQKRGFNGGFRVPIRLRKSIQPDEMAAVAATVAGRSTFLRQILRTTTSTRRISFSLRGTRISPSPSRFVRRELSSLRPVHSAIASACLVSKLPSYTNACGEGRFANYLSPI
ncbi:hypothetical protein SLA2020_363640 [Shorea laevis]